MSNTLTHFKVLNIPDDPDPTIIRPSDWAHEHIFNGGTDGAYLRYTSSQSDHASWDNIFARFPFIDVTKPPYSIPNDGTDAQSALSVLLTSVGTTGARLYFPPGTYSTSSSNPLFSITNSNISIEGATRGKTIFQQLGSGDVVTLNTINNISIRSITIDGNSSALRGIYTTNCTDCLFDNIEIQNCKDSAIVFDGANTQNNLIRFAKMSSQASALNASACIRMSAGKFNRVEHCYFHGLNYPIGLDVQAHDGFVGVANIFDTNFSTAAIQLDSAYTEIGHYYDTVGGLLGSVWNWLGDGDFNIIAPRGTLNLSRINNLATRNKQLLHIHGGALSTGAISLPVTGLVGGGAITAYYTILDNAVRLYIPAITGSSNSTSFTLTGLPGYLVPGKTMQAVVAVTDAGSSTLGTITATAASSIITLTVYPSGIFSSTWTASGVKSTSPVVLSYTLW